MALADTYTIAVNRIPDLFTGIRDGQAPEQLSQQILKDWGFQSSDDRAFLPGRYFKAAFSSNCTMDLHNNEAGATAGNLHFLSGTIHVAEDLIDQMEAKFDRAEFWAWNPPSANVNDHLHILKKSDQTSIFGP